METKNVVAADLFSRGKNCAGCQEHALLVYEVREKERDVTLSISCFVRPAFPFSPMFSVI